MCVGLLACVVLHVCNGCTPHVWFGLHVAMTLVLLSLLNSIHPYLHSIHPSLNSTHPQLNSPHPPRSISPHVTMTLVFLSLLQSFEKSVGL